MLLPPRALAVGVLGLCLSVVAIAAEPAATQPPSIASTSLQEIDTLLRTGDVAEACARLRTLAEKDDPAALFALGFLQEMGAGLVLDSGQSLTTLTKAATLGHKPAAAYLAWKFEHGFLTKPDPQKSARFAGLAGEGPFTTAPLPDYWLGVNERVFIPKIARAFLWLSDAAAQDDPLAQYNLAQYYFEGRYSAPDSRAYLRLLRQSADKNFGPAALQLSRLHSIGFLVDENAGEAARYLRVAADAGLPDAQFNLAKKLLRPGSPDTTEGLRLLELAAAQKHPEACLELGRRLRNGDGFPQNEARALEIFQSVADVAESDTLDEVAYAYETGRGTAQNLDQARNLYEKSAARGSSYAKFRLGTIALDHSANGKPDYPAALRWLEAASQDGNHSAMYRLGEMHRNGQGVPADPGAAFVWYERAARDGDLFAQKMVAWCLVTGTGVERDDEEAVTWYTLAAKKGDCLSSAQLGRHYANGLGVPVDLRAAKKHFLDSLRDDPDCTHLKLFGSIFFGLPKDRLPEARAVFSEHLANAAEVPNHDAETIIVDILLKGPADIRDKDAALAHLERRAAEKTLWAIETLSQVYLEGTYASQDLKKSYGYAVQAAALPESGANVMLAFHQILGAGCSIDEAGGLSDLINAAPASGRANFLLMQLHIFGLAVPENRERAADYLAQAARLQFQPARYLLSSASNDPKRAIAMTAPVQNNTPFDEKKFERKLAARIQNNQDVAAEAVSMPKPDFPPRLRFLNQNGEATIRFVLTSEGRTTEVVAINATHADFATAAVTAVKQWRFLPPMTGGKAKSVTMQIPVVFNLHEK